MMQGTARPHNPPTHTENEVTKTVRVRLQILLLPFYTKVELLVS